MKQRTWVIVLAVIAGLVGLIRVQQTGAQTQGAENLLVNPGFENGHHHQNNISEIVVPDGWRLHYVDGVTFPGAWDNLPAHRPESVVWNSQGGVPEGEEVFWRDGIYTLKVFKSWAPMYAALSQDVTGLEVGRRYRLVAPIYPDIVEEYSGGNKVPPSRPDSGQVRLGAGPTGATWRDEGAIAYSGWWTGKNVSPFYQAYPIFIHDFTATQPNMTVWIEFRSTYPYPNNGFFMDTMGLYTLDAVDNSVTNPAPAGGGAPAVPAGPTATPFPTPTPRADGAVFHVVQSGDTLWTIAIRYAPVMGLTPEEALPTIRDLNNNPTFINVGQELIIVPPGQPAPAAEEPTPEGEAETEDTAAEASEASPTPEPTPEPVVEPIAAEPENNSNSICVSAFDDGNGDGRRDAEGLIADAAISLFRDGSTVSTYVTDGINEPYCFQNLDAATYQVQLFPPADYMMTTTGSWAVAVSNGMSIAVEFGAQYDPNAGQVTVAEASAETAAAEPEAEAPESGGSNVGLIILGVAAVLILLAGVGVVLLRQS